jgi:hypothetical protein
MDTTQPSNSTSLVSGDGPPKPQSPGGVAQPVPASKCQTSVPVTAPTA